MKTLKKGDFCSCFFAWLGYLRVCACACLFAIDTDDTGIVIDTDLCTDSLGELFCGSFSLLIVMLSTRNAWGTHLAPYYLRGVPTDIFWTRVNIVAGRVLVVLIMISRHTSATTIRELWKSKGYHSQVLEVWQAQWLHGEVTGREKHQVWTWGSSCIRVESGIPRVSQIHSLLANLKYKSRNSGVGMEKAGSLKTLVI